jgi:hypothetical protein
MPVTRNTRKKARNGTKSGRTTNSKTLRTTETNVMSRILTCGAF